MIKITITEKYEKSLLLYEEFWRLYNITNVKLYKTFMYKIENQEYSDRFMRQINKCLKMFFDNFNKDEYRGKIEYRGYGNSTMYMEVAKLNDEENNIILFSFGKYNSSVSYVKINGEALSYEEKYKFNNSLIGTTEY